MKITCDWHIHSEHSCDEACLPTAQLATQVKEFGILDYGITDHIQTSYNLTDIAASRRSYLLSNPSPRFHFGIEASVISQWEVEEVAAGKAENPVWGIRSGGPVDGPLCIGFTEADIAVYGIEYVIGGTHWPMYVPFERETIIKDYHRQYMFLAQHPLVDIVAHPWWWQGHWASADGKYESEPWFDDFGAIPTSMHDELASAVIQNNKAIEINVGAFLFNPLYPERIKMQYQDYLIYMKSRGVQFSFGSDCHNRNYGSDFNESAKFLEAVGVTDEELWRLPPKTQI